MKQRYEEMRTTIERWLREIYTIQHDINDGYREFNQLNELESLLLKARSKLIDFIDSS